MSFDEMQRPNDVGFAICYVQFRKPIETALSRSIYEVAHAQSGCATVYTTTPKDAIHFKALTGIFISSIPIANRFLYRTG